MKYFIYNLGGSFFGSLLAFGFIKGLESAYKESLYTKRWCR